MTVKIAKTDDEILSCYEVIHELRPKVTKKSLVERIRRQGQEKYQLVYIEEKGKAVAFAGFREMEMLFSGKTIYVDDLATLPKFRKKGYAGELIDWIAAYAKKQKCFSVQLDSGVQRFDAHRFYLKKGFIIADHHFELGFRKT